jgi:hypothetical protein
VKAHKAIKTLLVAFPWLLICGYITFLFIRFNAEFSFGPLDVVRRITAPSGNKTALLVRAYGFIDLNFALYVTDDSMANVTNSAEDATFYTDKELISNSTAIWMKRALWISHDYEPTTMRNWHEAILWSKDSEVLAVIVEEKYIFAYCFSNKRGYEDSQEIEDLLAAHK